MKAGEYFEGCGKPRHKRETCQLTGHPKYNEKGQWIHSEGYKLKKAWNEANGKGEGHPELEWYAVGKKPSCRGEVQTGQIRKTTGA